jgi:hypothetical protein
LNARLVLSVKRQSLSLASIVEQLVGHAGLAGDTHASLELAAGLADRDVARPRHYNLLGSVVVLCAFTLILSRLNLRLLISGVKIFDDVSVKLLDLLLQWGQTLDPIENSEIKLNGRHATQLRWRLNYKRPNTRIWLSTTYLLEFIRAEKGSEEIFSSIGRFTEGIGTLEMPLSYKRFLSSLRFR